MTVIGNANKLDCLGHTHRIGRCVADGGGAHQMAPVTHAAKVRAAVCGIAHRSGNRLHFFGRSVTGIVGPRRERAHDDGSCHSRGACRSFCAG